MICFYRIILFVPLLFIAVLTGGEVTAKTGTFSPQKETIRVRIGAMPDGIRGRLGVGVSLPSDFIAKVLGDGQERGAFVQNLAPSGPAHRAGLHLGDIIIRINGHSIANAQAVSDVVSAISPGKTVDIVVWRTAKNLVGLLAKLKKRADGGDLSAILTLAYFHKEGIGVEKNQSKAALWYGKAALKGDADAQLKWGMVHEYGYGRLKEAVKWYRLAARQGHAKAQLEMGLAHQYGKEGEISLDKAIKWYASADRQGNGPAALRLAVALDNRGQLGDRQMALSAYTRGLDFREKKHGKDSVRVADVLQNMGALHEALAQYGEGLEVYHRARLIYQRKAGAKSGQVATILMNMGNIHAKLSQFDKALGNYRRALVIQEEKFDRFHENVADILLNMGNLHTRLFQHDKALKAYDRARRIYERNRDKSSIKIAGILANTGVIYERQSQFDKALSVFRQALKVYEQAGAQHRFSVADICSNMSVVYISLLQYDTALKFSRRALQIYGAANGEHSVKVADTLTNLGIIYSGISRHEEALGVYGRALQIYGKIFGKVSEQRASVFLNRGVTFGSLGRNDEALEDYDRALAIREKIFGKTHVKTASVAMNRANIYYDLARYEEALKAFDRVQLIREKAYGRTHVKFAMVIANKGNVYSSLSQYEKALNAYGRALPVYQKTYGGSSEKVAQMLVSMGNVHGRLSRRREAYTAYSKAAQIIVKRIGLLGGRTAHGLSLNDLKKRHKSKFVMQATAAYSYRLNRGDGSKLNDPAFRAAQWAQQTSASAALSQMSARYRAGNSELVVLVRQRQDKAEEWQETNRTLIGETSKLDGQQIPGKAKALRARLNSVAGEVAKIDIRLARDFSGFAEISNPQPLSIKQTQKLLTSKEALAQFLFAKDESFAWLVTKSGAKWVRLEIKEGELKRMVVTLRKGLDKNASQKKKRGNRPIGEAPRQPEGRKFDLHVAHKLYKILFGQFEEELKGIKHLMIVPSGALQSLPPSVLVTSQPAHQYGTYKELAQTSWLIKKMALTMLPSVSSLKALRVFAKKSGRDRTPFIGIGNPVLQGPSALPKPANKGLQAQNEPAASNKPVKTTPRDAGAMSVNLASLYQRNGLANVSSVRSLRRLPDTATELKRIAHSLHAANDALYLGERASEPVIKSAVLKKAKVIAFATHALVAGELEGLAEPALVLTPPDKASRENDGLLMASEVAQLKLDADWVLLSACNTASGDGTPGAEGLSGLARAFFYAGARSLLVSHWPVYSDAAVSLTTGAFEAQEKDPAIGRSEALRQSILVFMGDPEHLQNAHPERWAPFVIVGEGAARAQ